MMWLVVAGFAFAAPETTTPPPAAPAPEAAPQGPSPLELAYQKEYAYLTAEKAELEARLAEFDADAASRTATADAEIDQLQARLVSTSRAADQAEDAFDAVERETAAMDDAAAVLSSSVSQASETLGLEAPTDPAAAVPPVFQAAAATLRDAGATGWKDGSFFLSDGTQVAGRIYRWGQIAAWGTSDKGSGALAPAGEGRLQMRRDFGRDTATELAAGKRPSELEVQLFEPERATAEAEKGGGLFQTLDDAGTMGQLLFGLGCVSATLVVIRGITLGFARRGGARLVEAVTRFVREDKLDKAEAVLGKRSNPTARVLGTILDSADRSKDELDRVVEESLLRELPKVDRFASALVVITAGAPLLGLLGTVTGMIATFDVITEHGTGNPKLMSAGIAEALVCTALGLSVAIPTLLAGNVLASFGESIKNTLERGSLALLNALEAHRDEPTEMHGEMRGVGVIALFGHVRNLWSGGGVVMPALFCTAFVLWSTLGHRILGLRRGAKGALRRLVMVALNEPSPTPGHGIIGEAVQRGAQLWRERGGPVPQDLLDEHFGDLEDRLSSGTTLARVLVGMAPLLGLLGTVTGLIETFGSLGTSSTSAASEGIASGIVVALYATQMGLAIAVPGLLMGGILHHKEERLAMELDELKEIFGGALSSVRRAA